MLLGLVGALQAGIWGSWNPPQGRLLEEKKEGGRAPRGPIALWPFTVSTLGILTAACGVGLNKGSPPYPQFVGREKAQQVQHSQEYPVSCGDLI